MKKTAFLDEIRGLDVSALREKTKSLREELMKTRFRAKTSGAAQVGHKFSQIKKNLARTLTTLAQKKA